MGMIAGIAMRGPAIGPAPGPADGRTPAVGRGERLAAAEPIGKAPCNGLSRSLCPFYRDLAGQSGRSALADAGRTFGRIYPDIDKPGRKTLKPERLRPTCTASDKEHPMNTGTVKFYNDQKGFGFIQPDNGQKDVFVHATALERAGLRGLVEGQKVAFDTAEDRRTGKIAVNNLQVA
jgi:CspA family cold shock protein